MKRKPSANNIYWLVFIFMLIVFIVFLIIVFGLTIPLVARLFLFLCPLTFIIFGAGLWYLSRKTLSRFTDDISKLLDEMINESKEISFIFNEE